jgi:hypothetical protein
LWLLTACRAVEHTMAPRRSEAQSLPRSMNRSRVMKSAWIITQEGTQHRTEVLSVLSARKRPETIREYLEWLHTLLQYSPEEHFATARYNKPVKPYEAEYSETGSGNERNRITCGHNPYLEARLGRNVSLKDTDTDAPNVEWTEPDRLIRDRDTLRVERKVAGKTRCAPINVPLRRG